MRFCNQRGTAEHWIKQGNSAVKWTLLSCHTFAREKPKKDWRKSLQICGDGTKSIDWKAEYEEISKWSSFNGYQG
ncbi:MAG: hypothetical protein ACLQU4_21415 [Limisphaerales bacterium]